MLKPTVGSAANSVLGTKSFRMRKQAYESFEKQVSCQSPNTLWSEPKT
jgi:hypothetical protein